MAVSHSFTVLSFLQLGDEVQWLYTGCSLQSAQKRKMLTTTGRFAFSMSTHCQFSCSLQHFCNHPRQTCLFPIFQSFNRFANPNTIYRAFFNLAECMKIPVIFFVHQFCHILLLNFPGESFKQLEPVKCCSSLAIYFAILKSWSWFSYLS